VGSQSSAVATSSYSSLAAADKAPYLAALKAKINDIHHYILTQDSYDQAMDSNFVPIIGKFTVSRNRNEVSLFDNKIFKNVASSSLFDTPVSMLESPSGTSTVLSSHEYYLQDQSSQVVFIDHSHEVGANTISYAGYPHDLIHDYSLCNDAFSGIPLAQTSPLLEGMDYFTAWAAKEPDEFELDNTDPYGESVATNADGTSTYKESIHYLLCHYGDEYQINRKFTYFVNLAADQSLLSYGLSIQTYQPIYDDNNNLTGFDNDSGMTFTYTSVSSETLGDDSEALPDYSVYSTDSEGNALNKDGETVINNVVQPVLYDSSTLSLAGLADEAVQKKLLSSLPLYLDYASSCTMSGTLSNAPTGASYSESWTSSVKDNVLSYSGEAKGKSVSQSETDSSISYGSDEDVTYSASITATREALSFSETKNVETSSVYQSFDPLNGVSPLRTFNFSGDFIVPDFLAGSLEDYLDPSLGLRSDFKLLTLDLSASKENSDGSLLLSLSDYSSTFVVHLSRNKILDILMTSSVDVDGSSKVKTFTLAA
jgi:hypothetical protein